MPYKKPEDARAARRRSREKLGRAKDREWENSQSKEWKRARHLKKTYGITVEIFGEMLAAQGGGCAICAVKECPSHRENLSVDHDHETGVVRGLLCHHCNLLLGYAGDSVERLKQAIAYLGGGDAHAL